MTIMVPLGNVAFTFPFMPEHQPLHTKDIVGLIAIMAGLFVYRFLEDMLLSWKSRQDPYINEKGDNTNELKRALIGFEGGDSSEGEDV